MLPDPVLKDLKGRIGFADGSAGGCEERSFKMAPILEGWATGSVGLAFTEIRKAMRSQGDTEIETFRLGRVKRHQQTATEKSEFMFFSQAIPFWSSISSLSLQAKHTLDALPHVCEESFSSRAPIQ